ncbi:hypothetical protein GQ53DRAFT_744766 [Thozetella sp. PMI_491]|nr:hypothetical protein GQ53DRAFT_744766 [Thozetella sp. PMI_491]
MATEPTLSTSAKTNDKPLDQDELNEIHAALAAAGIPPITIETREQYNFFKSTLAARSGAPVDDSILHKWQKFPGLVRERLGTQTHDKLNECIGRVLDSEAEGDERKKAEKEGRALLSGDEELESIYDNLLSSSTAVSMAKEMRTTAEAAV